jgi:tRNA(adenine34) deaminase
MRQPDEDERLMRRALALAQIAAGRGETPVGAVVVQAGKVIGEGHERTREGLDPSAHAEVEAIRNACQCLQTLDLSACSLYTTVEPCVLCGYAVRRTRITRVIYGVPAGQAGAVTSKYAVLTDADVIGWSAPPIVRAGILANDCLEMLRRSVRRG